MTPAELKQTLTDVETIKVALAKAREAAHSAECRLAPIPDTSKACQVFNGVQTNVQYCENDLMDLTFTLNIADLNSLLGIETKVRDA